MLKTVLLLAAVALVQARPGEHPEHPKVVCPPHFFGNLPHEYDCTKFYMCSAGTQFQLSCFPGFHFNAAMMVCVRAEHEECPSHGPRLDGPSDITSSNDKLVQSEQVSSDICPPHFFGNLPHEYDCTKYYACMAGIQFDLTCFPGFHFNAAKMVCVWADHEECPSHGPRLDGPSDITSSNDKLVQSEQVSSDICQPHFFGNLPHEYDCTRYYACMGGIQFNMTCFPGFHFNAAKMVCVWADHEECPSASPRLDGPSDITSSNDKLIQSEQVSSDICPSSFIGTVPHESDCSKFYMCIQGVKVELVCPSGTFYDPELKVCDWSPSAGCVV